MSQLRSMLIIIAGIYMTCSVAWGGETIDLTEGWRFAPDTDQKGLDKGWQTPGFDDSSWVTLKAGVRWEDQGFPKLDGHAWYRKRILVPATMRSDHIWLNLGGLNDSGVVYCNGQKVGVFGEENRSSMARIPLAVDFASTIRWGEENLVAIQVFDMGNSGGLTTAPIALTTDKTTLAVKSLLKFVPGFDGRSSIVGMRIGALGVMKGGQVRFAVKVNGKNIDTGEAVVANDHEGIPVGTAHFNLAARPGDAVCVTAEIMSTPGEPGSSLSLEKMYVWPKFPQWKGKYHKLRVLNNFVTELKQVTAVHGEILKCSFPNPREGWVFIRVHGEVDPVAHIDNGSDAIIWRKHPETGAYEAMQYLSEGKHVLCLEHANGARLDIRAVPELAFCYWPTNTVIKALPPRDRAFAERYVFPNTNTLLTHDDMTEKEFDSWRAEGRRWLSNASLPGLHDETPPTVDAVYQTFAANACMKRPGYSGVIVDEFLDNPAPFYAAWTEAMEQLYKSPGFKGQTYCAWVVETHKYKQGLDFMRRLYDQGGHFVWERYIHEGPTEELAMLRLYELLGGIEEMNALIPGLQQRLSYCLGSFTIPWYSLNINPGANYISFMDKQFQVLATDPAFFSVMGLSQWTAHYTDDDVLRYAMRLYRHYCIEGKRTPYKDYPYTLTYIKNPDFTDGLNDWHVEAAKTESIVGDELSILGEIQGRWACAGVGDKCAVMVRSESGPNRIGQTVKGLQSGQLYSMKFIAADLNDLNSEKEVGLWPVLDGAEVLPDRSFRCTMPSVSTLKLKNIDSEHRAYITYCQVMFRPKSEQVELTFSDWKDGKPAGPTGQKIGFNFVEIQPYYDEK